MIKVNTHLNQQLKENVNCGYGLKLIIGINFYYLNQLIVGNHDQVF